MSMTLVTADLYQLIPLFMRKDEAVKSMAKALSELIREPSMGIPRIREWDQIDKMTSPELDELAWEMALEWYDETVSVENKRATIKAAILLKEKMGTKWAVEEAVHAAYGVDPDLKEWFEYVGGHPGHFKVKIDANGSFDFDRIIRAINYVKRASAKLDEIEIVSHEHMDLYFGAGMVIIEEVTLPPMSADDVGELTWLVDEEGNMLTDEEGNVLTP